MKVRVLPSYQTPRGGTALVAAPTGGTGFARHSGQVIQAPAVLGLTRGKREGWPGAGDCHHLARVDKTNEPWCGCTPSCSGYCRQASGPGSSEGCLQSAPLAQAALLATHLAQQPKAKPRRG